MNCSLKNLHKSLKIRIFECGSEQRTAIIDGNKNVSFFFFNTYSKIVKRKANSEQRTANIACNKQLYLSIKKSILGEYFSPKWIFLCAKN